ncbi:polysaccharide deacetylase family protein [Cohnella rhizosphaerae]|uniref:Polysaccharide deacetylase family protein n=1 Tax=Cohnella rhizosphaerae TaxID=1457232 RepID=A0A9X4QV74_9BACL|nr:polysaccharide deacetylase family protein [Cohnella rhizosphaerae]MDG0812470.1 polysaccharide deacetylase family protein [Cohnella rhizosphaerae]
MSKTRWPSAVMLALLVLLLGAGRYGPLRAYVESAKSASGEATYAETGFLGNNERQTAEEAQTTEERALKAWLTAEAKKRAVKPKNAVVDRVWKAMPGYNGKAVDVDATYAKAAAAGWTAASASADPEKIPWVYREIAPQVSLQDLPPSPVYRGNPAKPAVGLMINVAWGNEYLASILNTLDEEHAKATFFLDGSWLSKNEAAAEEIKRRGHEVSNHAYSHKNMSTITDAKQLEEIAKTQTLLKKDAGRRQPPVRPAFRRFRRQNGANRGRARTDDGSVDARYRRLEATARGRRRRQDRGGRRSGNAYFNAPDADDRASAQRHYSRVEGQGARARNRVGGPVRTPVGRFVSG